MEVKIESRRSLDKSKFILDSGSTINLTSNKSILQNFKYLSRRRFVRCASGKRLEIMGVGFIYGIGEVFYVPDATVNLLSISCLTKSGKSITFTKDKVFLNGKLIGELDGKLYYKHVENDFCSQSVAEDEFFYSDDVHLLEESDESPTMELFHRRYGHTNIADLKALIRLEAVTGYKISPEKANPDQFHCDSCAICKATKQSRDPTKSAPRPILTAEKKELYFDCVYTDVIGPMQTKGTKGHLYGLTFTEMATRYRFFYPLAKKSDTLKAFMSLNAEVVALGYKIKQLKSDNGGEYISEEFKNFCILKEISQRFTTPHTPQSNSVSERFNRILGEHTRSMLHSANLPNNLWPFVMQTVTYLSNRLISPKCPTKSKTPFELIFGVKPDVSNLRSYGCLAYAYDFNVHRKKLDDRAIKGILIGYDTVSAGYLIFIPSTGKIIRSGHVKFNEHELFFKSKPIDEPPLKTAASETVKAVTVSSKSTNPVGDVAVSTATADIVPALAVRNSTPVHIPLNNASPLEISGSSSAVASSILVSTITAPSTASTDDIAGSKRSRGGRILKPKVIHEAQCIHEVDSVCLPASKNRAHRASSLTHQRALRAFIENEDDYSLEDLLLHVGEEDIELVDNDAPSTFKKIYGRSDADSWMQAIESENLSIASHDVFQRVDKLPPGKSTIKVKYIFKRKDNGRYKARLVAMGYSQIPGLDFNETYAPVVSKQSIRTLFALASVENWNIFQMDVKTAFLHAPLQEDIFAEACDGMQFPKGSILKLMKSLYGLKQAPREWYLQLSKFIIDQGYTKSKVDAGVYFKGSGVNKIIISVYVDDILIFGGDYVTPEILELKAKLDAEFKLDDLGMVKNILGMEVQRERNMVYLSQNKYLNKQLLKFQVPLTPQRRKAVPITKAAYAEVVDIRAKRSASVLDKKEYPFRSLIGSLLYANICTRPDISFTLSTLASHNSDPRLMHWNALVDLLRYLRDSQENKIVYGKLSTTETKNVLSVYADADFAMDTVGRKSRTGYVIFLNGGAIAWNSSLQSTVAQSTSEAELYAMVEAVNSAMQLKHFLEEIGFPQGTLQCYEDNTGCIDWVVNQRASSRMKHIEVKYHVLRELREKSLCKFEHIETKLQKSRFCYKADGLLDI